MQISSASLSMATSLFSTSQTATASIDDGALCPPPPASPFPKAHIGEILSYGKADPDDWCPTKPIGPPIPHSLGEAFGAQVALNPQPLPPASAGGSMGASAFMSEDDIPRCGNEPRPLPHSLGDMFSAPSLHADISQIANAAFGG